MSKSRTTRYLQRKAVERIPGPALNAVGKAVLAAVDKAVADRWDRALAVAAEADGDTIDARVRSISKRFRRELGAMGAATGAVAAAPVLGTAAAATALAADLGWVAMRATDLIMAIGAAHGYTMSTVEERRAWVLSVLAFGEDAADQFSSLLTEIDASLLIGGERVSARLAGLAGSDAATLDALRRINTTLAAMVVKKYGTRRSLLAVGKLLPFGVGAVVGGSANYALTRVIGSQTNRFFSGYEALLPPPPIPPIPRPNAAVSDGTPMVDGAPMTTGDHLHGGPPPPTPSSTRLPNPPAKLSKRDRRKAIPTKSRQK